MKRVGVLLIFAAACSNGAGDDEYPIAPPGGGGGDQGGGGGSGSDAGVDAPEPMITARVCLVTNLKSTLCAGSGANGIVVHLGTKMASTRADGTFDIVAQPDDTWRVDGNPVEGPIYPTQMQKLTDTDEIIVMRTVDYKTLVNANTGADPLADQGSILVRAVRNGPLADATVSLNPVLPVDQRFYDGANDLMWDTDRTGPLGLAWIPNAPLVGETVRVTAMDPTKFKDKIVMPAPRTLTVVTIVVP